MNEQTEQQKTAEASKSDVDPLVMPCPFCGQKPSVGVVLGTLNDNFELAVVKCENHKCNVKPSVGSTMKTGEAVQAAIRRWNIRA